MQQAETYYSPGEITLFTQRCL